MTPALLPLVAAGITGLAACAASAEGLGDRAANPVPRAGGSVLPTSSFHDPNSPVRQPPRSTLSPDSTLAVAEHKIVPSDGENYDMFGYSACIVGDYLIVGTPGSDLKGRTSGSAYLCERSGDMWNALPRLTPRDGTSNDWFGCAVALGPPYAVVGAFGSGARGYVSGAAYVFERAGGVWSETSKLLPSDGSPGDRFGESLGIDGDTIVAGARGVSNGNSSGAAYLFRRHGTNWLQEARLTPAQSAPGDYFGTSTAIHGDFAAVGAPGDDAEGVCAGAVYVFARCGTNWMQEARLAAADGKYGDRFGYSLSLQSNRLAVGAFRHDQAAFDAGAVYVFTRGTSNWVHEAKLVAADGGVGDRFGASVSLSGDRIVVGAYKHAYNTTVSGASYVFGRNGTNWTQVAELTASDGGIYGGYLPGHFGQSVSVSWPRAAVGARLAGGRQSGFILSGAVYVYDVE